MAKDKLTDYDATASNNTDVGGISVAEGMLPSGVNNAIREQMSHLADFAAGTSGVDVLKLQDDTDTNSIKLQAPASVTADTTFTMPDGDGSADQVLKTNGSGQLGWADRHANPSLIINGAMQVAQRGASGGTATTTASYLCVDRFKSDIDGSGGGDFSHAQVEDAPSGQGFRYASKITTVTQASQPTSESNRHQLYTLLEKQNTFHLDWGTSAAKTCTLSFWVKGSVTGIYNMMFAHYGGAAGSTATYYYYTNYTIDSADTWEKKTITLTGPTVGGNERDGNSFGTRVEWTIGVGSDAETGTLEEWTTSSTYRTTPNSVYLPENAGATLYITGVKLEVGSTATDFVHRSYGEELALCQRYYEEWGGEDAYQPFGYFEGTGTVGYSVFQFNEKRDSPTVTVSDAAHFQSARGAVAFTAMSFSQPTTTHVFCTISRSGNNWASGEMFSWRANNSTSARIYFNAEL
jgi:hypothetical protein